LVSHMARPRREASRRGASRRIGAGDGRREGGRRAARGGGRRCRLDALPGTARPRLCPGRPRRQPAPRAHQPLSDVLVLGAGAARALARGGADVTVLEARDRVGGRVEQLCVDDGRPVQLGGEVVGEFHTAYLGLVDELGLTLQPSYTAVAGETTYDLVEGVSR